MIACSKRTLKLWERGVSLKSLLVLCHEAGHSSLLKFYALKLPHDSKNFSKTDGKLSLSVILTQPGLKMQFTR
jgi:hypothetical protein